MTLTPIGLFLTDNRYPYEASRQPASDTGNTRGEIRLHPGLGFEQAVSDLDGFERIWIIYQFHHNSEWKPKVMPPRGPRLKRGVFATRAPYRPNALGLSCVRLIKVDGLRVLVEGHDILDGTLVFDIKPYLPYADSFPRARVGWLERVECDRWQIAFTRQADAHIEWLEGHGLSRLRGFILRQLEFDPLDHKRKRVTALADGHRLAYRTWDVEFTTDLKTRRIQVQSILSRYSNCDLAATEDLYGDKGLHRQFIIKFIDFLSL